MTPPLPPIPPGRLRVSVVMPVHSELESVREVFEALSRGLGERLLEVVLVVSPASPESCRALCDTLARDDARVRVLVQAVTPGVGNAVREGLRACRGNVVVTIDSDGEMDAATAPLLVDEIARGHDLVTASRWKGRGGFVGYDPLKRVLNWGFQRLFRVAYGTTLTDLTFGYKAMRAELAHGLEWRAELHEIGCETTLRPLRAGARATEVATRWTRRRDGVSKNSFLKNFRYVAMSLSILRDAGPVRVGDGAAEAAHG